MGKTIAVLGAGNGGQAMAAEMTKAGHKVRLYEHPQFAAGVKNLLVNKEIEITGEILRGRFKLDLVTTEIKQAVDGAEFLFMPVPSFAHSVYADLLAPLLEDGQIVILFPGSLGTLFMKNRFTELGMKKNVVLCETHTLPYDCRLEAPGRVNILWKNRPLLLGVFPSARTEETMKRLGGDFYEFKPADDVLEIGLNSLNPVLHLPACIMNTGRIERSRGEFWLYEEGFTKTVCEVTDAVDRERISLAKAYGYSVPSLAEELAEHLQPRDLFFEINGSSSLVIIKGPTSVESRYFTEDIPFGLVAWVQLGDKIGFPTPLLDALLAIGSVIIKQNTLVTGRTLDTLGISDMSIADLKKYLRNGYV